MKKLMIFVCAVTLVFGVVGTANALTLAAVEGSWISWDDGINVNTPSDVPIGYGNGLEDQIRWGVVSQGQEQSGLGFTGVGTPLTFGVGEVFEIGQLRHFNNPIAVNSAVTAADLTISLTFSVPVLGPETFDFTFEINETPNVPEPPYPPGTSDDIITFPDSYPTETFDIGGVAYTLQLLGFGDTPDPLLDQFVSPEGGTSATKLWGRITTPSGVIPEPSTVLLLGIGLIGLAGLGRKKLLKK